VSLAATFLLLASLARSAVLLVFEVALGRRGRRPLPVIVRDITQGLVWIGILLVALHTAGVEPGSILTTSALLTAAIALSLQETRSVLESAPDLAVHVSRVIAERQAALEQESAAASLRRPPASTEERSSQLLGRIRKFFSL